MGKRSPQARLGGTVECIAAKVTISATAKNRCFSCKRRRHPSGQAVAIQKQEWPPCIHIAGQATGNVKMSEGKKIASRPRVGVNESSAVTTL
jgi:hypothetical protein